MKTIKRFLAFATIVLITTMASLTATAQIQPPPPPGGSEGPGGGSTPNGGGAPIGGGVAILLSLGAAYGGKKYYDYFKKLKNDHEE